MRWSSMNAGGRHVGPCLSWSMFCLAWLWCAAVGAVETRAPSLDLAKVAESPVALSPYFEVVEDPQGLWTLSDMLSTEGAGRFKPWPHAQKSVNLGITKSALWLRVHVYNGDSKSVDRMLEIAYSRLALVDFYVQRPGETLQKIHTGYFRPFAQRAFGHRHFVFPVNLAPGDRHTLYLRVESQTSLEVPARIWTRDAFSEYHRDDYMLQSAFFGLVIGSILFNALLWLSLRDPAYLYYLLFITSNSLSAASSTGIGTEFLWPDSSQWSNISFAVSSLMTGVGLMAFTRRMVETERFLPRLDHMLKFLVVLNLFAALVMFFSYLVQLAILLMVLDAVFVIAAMAVQSWRGHRVAQICLAAFLILATGVLMASLRLAGLLDTNFLTLNGVQIGAAIETIVLAFALADRFHVVRAEKARAQRDALLAERQLVDTLRASERLLEERVQARTAELTQALQDLQRTQADLIEAEKLASLGALVAGVAHELNTPIGNALTTASTMEEAAQSLKQNVQDGSLKRSFLEGFVNSNLEMAQLVVRACRRAATLISSFKRVAVDQTSEQQRCFDLAELVEDNLRALRPSFGAQTWVIDNQVMAVTECDSYPGPLGQVLTNLVQNAVLHGFVGRETGTVKISAQCEDGYVELQVSDDGIGMPDSTLAHIFDPFFTTTLGKGGSGLGLAVCRNLVRGVLGGSIRVQSSPGKGTSFFVRFPQTASR